MNLTGSALVYCGLALLVVALARLVRPRAIAGLTGRQPGMVLVVAGTLLVAIGVSLPAPAQRATSATTRLDEMIPSWQFSERHSTRVRASPERVYAAMESVTAGDIRFFQTLTSIRRFGRPGPESILNAPDRQPIIKVATSTTFSVLAEERNRELVIGTMVVAPRGWRRRQLTGPDSFRVLEEPGFAKAAMNFRIEADSAGGSILITETRVYATDEKSRRRFARYWRLIYPGSALIRIEWLRAIKRKAELAR
jgi:hypothetical protein